VVEEHAEERPADELEESIELADAEAEVPEAPSGAAEDTSADTEQGIDSAAPDASTEAHEATEAEQQVGELSDSEDVGTEAEVDPDDEAEDHPIDEPAAEDESGDEHLEETVEADEPEESDVEDEESLSQKEDIDIEAEEAEAPQDEPEAETNKDEEDPIATEAVAEEDRHWYVVHCYSGYENKVRHNLEQRIETMGMKSKIFDVVVPTEEEIEVKDGKRRTVERRVFPGYILVQMQMDEDSWYVVRNTPGVTGFVGMGNDPTPLRQEEVAQIVKRMEAEAPRIKVTYKTGQKVRIIDGPFNDFIGTVSDIDMERAKVRVMVSFFGRETPVELDFLQVEKA
jgi:transcriptional antiterminator NusG